METDIMKKMLEQLQTEFRQDAETLATLQTIYAERVKQIRTNRTLPPDIQQRFLTEWEQFYDQRVSGIFNYNGVNPGNAEEAENPTAAPALAESEAPAKSFGIETMESRPKKNRA